MTLIRRIWFFVTRWRRLQDLDAEMRLHVEMRADANRRRGLAPDEAMRVAKARFGNSLKLREETRDVWGFSGVERVTDDLRSAMRQLIRRPTWTVVVVLTLALGVGANVSVFTLVDTMLLKPPSWNHDDRLAWIVSVNPLSGRVFNVSYSDYLAYHDHATTLSAVLAGGGKAFSVGGPHPQRVHGGLVSANFFDVLAIRAARGRTFAPGDDVAGAHAVTVLSDAFWREQFGADPSVIGRSVPINGTPFTIIGIAPAGFTGLAYADDAEQLWVPLAMQRLLTPTGSGFFPANTPWLRVVGRLRDGVTVAQSDAEVRVLAEPLNPAGTPRQRKRSARVMSVQGGMTPWEQHDLGPVFGLIAIVPGLVLLIACANVANVLMAHHVSRRREFAMRRAIGASRGRLVRLLLTEALVLALLSAVAGFAVSFGLTALIARIGNVPAEVTALLVPDRRALLAALAAAMLTTVVFGLAPSLTATRFEVLPTLKDEGPTSTAGGGGRLRRLFVVVQVAVSLALLIAAGLFLQSLSKALRVDPGFDIRSAVAVSFDPDLQGYDAARRDAFIAQLIERASSLRGVTSAAVTSSLPLGGETFGAEVISESRTAPVLAMVESISPRYFQTMRLTLLRGRDFSDTDTADAPPVAIVSDTAARRLWPGADPLGRSVRGVDSNAPWREVVGVVGDVRHGSLTESAQAAYYLPLSQHADSPLSLVVRGAADPAALLRSLADVAHDLDRDLPLFNMRTLEAGVRRSLNLRRASASLFAVFGGLAVLLAAIGVYGVVAHSVSLRTREVGIRMSLGARAADVFRMFVRESLRLSLVGVAIGLGISAAMSKLLTSFLFGLTATDTVTFAGASAILCVVAMVATCLPARRAAHVDPLVALRHD
jgi:putative ABC transport system permease protein